MLGTKITMRFILYAKCEKEKWCFEPRDCGVCRSDRRYSSALLEVLLQMAQNKAARSRSGWQEAQKIAHKCWMGEVPRKGPKNCQTGISAVDSLAIHSLITCCSSSRESFWMIDTDGFLDDLQWWLLTKNQLISGWFTKNQLITHQKRFAHQDCAATVPKIQWYVICLICASAAGVLIHFMELKIFLALGYHGDHARFVNSIILWDINEDICFLKADSGYVKGWKINWLWEKNNSISGCWMIWSCPESHAYNVLQISFHWQPRRLAQRVPSRKFQRASSRSLTCFQGLRGMPRMNLENIGANELWLQDAPLGWWLSGILLPNIFRIAIIVINHAVERDDRRFRILLKWHQIWMTPLFSI